MPGKADSFAPGKGRLTHGPQVNALAERTLEFVREELPRWRDRADRKPQTDEELLNAQLCKHLEARARQSQFPVLFHHEERQTARRRVDISAGPAEGGFIGTTYHSIDDPFLVVEGKRLPSPGGKAREREYVTGHEKKSGGIQRFKLGLHGERVATAALIGYIQKSNPAAWHERINLWIRDLSSGLQLRDEKWTSDDQLRPLNYNRSLRTASCESRHRRVENCALPKILLRHLWVEMS